MMIKKVVGKLARGVLLLIGISILAFSMMKISPVDPILASVNYDSSLTKEQYDAIAEYWGLNDSAVVQYQKWMTHFIKGDLGQSRVYRRPVAEIIRNKAGASAILMGSSWIVSGVLGFILGALAAFHNGKVWDKLIKWLSYFQVSVPTFWIGLIFLLIFAVQLQWFPIGTSRPIGVLSGEVSWADRLRHLVLPMLTLSVLGTANVTLHTREKMLDVLSSEYVLFARARGMSDFEIFRYHGFRNAIVPAVTLHFSHFGELFGGSVLAEQVFSYPGLGSSLTEAGLKSDTSLLLAIVIIGAVFVFLGNTIADILSALTDPYLRSGD